MRELDKNSLIKEMLPHRYPFLFVDRIIEIVPKEKVVCIKNVSVNEPFFEGHFPDRPVMPGVLIIEAAAQAASFLFYADTHHKKISPREYMLASVKADFVNPVLPGDQLEITVIPEKLVLEAAIVKALCKVKNELVAKCNLVLSAKKR